MAFLNGPATANPSDIWQKGTATLVGGTIAVTGVTLRTPDMIVLTRDTPGGTTGDLSVDVATRVNSVAGPQTGQFVINSTNALDTSTVRWWINSGGAP